MDTRVSSLASSTNNRLDEAHSLLMKYAAKNGVNVDAKHLKHVISEVRKADVRKNDTRKYGTFDLFRTPKRRTEENRYLLFQLVSCLISEVT